MLPICRRRYHRRDPKVECWNPTSARLIPTIRIITAQTHLGDRENGSAGNIPAMMAAVVVISVPLIVLFLIFLNKIMAGVSRGGTKG